MSTQQHPRIGIIGGGTISHSHVKGLREQGCDVVAVADPSERAREVMQETFELRGYASHDELLAEEKLDAVSVCTPNAFHAPLAITALEQGLNVLCEKPPATSFDDALKMHRAAEQSGKLLMMGFNHRFDAHAQQLARMRRDGFFGEIYHGKTAWIRRRGIPGMGGWFTTRELSGGGPVYDIGIHVLDRAWYLMGRPKPKAVSAVTYARFSDIDSYVYANMWAGPARKGGTVDTEDFAAALVRFDNGASLQLEVSWAANREDEPPQTMVMGEKAGALWQGGDVTLYAEQGNAITTSQMIYNKQPYQDRFAHFAASLRGEADCSCTSADGVCIQAMLDGIYQSAEQQAEVAVAIPDDVQLPPEAS